MNSTSELMLVGVLKMLARIEELERACTALQAENERLDKKLKAPVAPPKENEGNEDG